MAVSRFIRGYDDQLVSADNVDYFYVRTITVGSNYAVVVRTGGLNVDVKQGYPSVAAAQADLEVFSQALFYSVYDPTP